MPRKKSEKDRKEGAKKEKVTEYFEVRGKKGKGKTLKATGFENETIVKKGQIRQENKILMGIFITLIIIVLVLAGVYFFFQSTGKFTYKGINFNVVREIAPYQTSLPVIYDGEKRDYNFYLRNNPKSLEPIPFNGEIIFAPIMVLNATESINCNGDGIIGIANLNNLYKIIGIKVIKDEKAMCDGSGNYMYLNILKGNETRIDETGRACYEITVNNCEVLKGTEKFMIETLAQINKMNQQNS